MRGWATLTAGSFPVRQSEDREMVLEEFKGSARRPPEAVDRLIRIAYRKNISVLPRQHVKDFHLGEVRILEFVDQNEPGVLLLLLSRSGSFFRRHTRG